MPGFARELIRSRGRHTCIIHAYLVEREFARVEGGEEEDGYIQAYYHYP